MTQASQPQLLSSGEVPLSGGMLWVAAMVLAAANFIAVLNLTLANVSVPSIAGSLGATTSQGIWVITSFAVGEAITVPLTGWLAGRFGSVRVFVSSLLLFTLFSALSGVSTTLGLLVVARIFSGLCRRAADAAVANPAAAYFPARKKRRWPSPSGR
jgi:Arabinose efflux permease